MNLTAAAALSKCRSALVESPTAARSALAKHQASIAPELVQALETVGNYTTNEVPLHITTLTPSSDPFTLSIHATMSPSE